MSTTEDLRERMAKALFLAAADTDTDVDDVWVEGDLSKFTDAAMSINEAERERLAVIIETNRDGVSNPEKPYNQAFLHGCDCAARWVRDGGAS